MNSRLPILKFWSSRILKLCVQDSMHFALKFANARSLCYLKSLLDFMITFLPFATFYDHRFDTVNRTFRSDVTFDGFHAIFKIFHKFVFAIKFYYLD